jgi:uncharacterized membrane protein SpoIIM required for sporulation
MVVSTPRRPSNRLLDLSGIDRPDAERVDRLMMFGYYIRNNISVIPVLCRRTVRGGWKPFFLAYNGAFSGALAGYLAGRGLSSTFFRSSQPTRRSS